MEYGVFLKQQEIRRFCADEFYSDAGRFRFLTPADNRGHPYSFSMTRKVHINLDGLPYPGRAVRFNEDTPDRYVAGQGIREADGYGTNLNRNNALSTRVFTSFGLFCWAQNLSPYD